MLGRTLPLLSLPAARWQASLGSVVSMSHAGADFSRLSAFSDEELDGPRSHHIATTENVQHRRDVLPSPPISPNSQQLMRTTANGSPSSSLPSVRKSHATVIEVPDATTHSYGLYGEPRYPNSRSSEKPPFTNTSTSSAMKLDAAEVCISIYLLFSTLCPPFDFTRFENVMSRV